MPPRDVSVFFPRNSLVRAFNIVAVMCVAGLGIGRAEENKSIDANKADQSGGPPIEYPVKTLSAGMVEIGKPVLLGIYGAF